MTGGWIRERRRGASRRDGETRGNAEEYGGRGREDDGKCAWKRKCTRMNTAGGAREDDARVRWTADYARAGGVVD